MAQADAPPPLARQAGAEETMLVVVTGRVDEQSQAYSEADEWPG